MKKWLVMAAATVLLGVAVIAYLIFPRSETELLTETDAGSTVAALYGGDVEAATSSGDFFLVEFTRPDGRYTASVNKESGQVEGLELIEKKKQRLTEAEAAEIALAKADGEVKEVAYTKESDAYTVEIETTEGLATIVLSAATGDVTKVTSAANEPPTPPEPEPERVITSEEAVEIAKQTLDGEVQDIEFEDTADGGYYLVEIEKDETDQDVTVQIHAIRGETLAVEWDD